MSAMALNEPNLPPNPLRPRAFDGKGIERLKRKFLTIRFYRLRGEAFPTTR
jgi:hypothetical protein